MATLQILHTGDEHLNKTTHASTNPKTGINTLWESNVAVVKCAVAGAVERGVSAYVTAGDLFDDGVPSPEALMLAVDALKPLAEARIPIVLLHGNHHATRVRDRHRTLVHPVAEMLRAAGGIVYAVDQPELIRLPNGLQIAALPWMAKNSILAELGVTGLTPAERNMRVAQHGIDLLEQMALAADLSAPLIMTAHATVDTTRFDGPNGDVERAHHFNEPVLSLQKLNELPFSYGGLSHIHRSQQLSDRYWYAGSLNRLDFSDLNDTKGANLVTLGEQREMTVERLLTPARGMAMVDLESEDMKAQLDGIADGDLVRVFMETGQTAIPQPIRAAIHRAGATIVETKPRPKLSEPVDRVTLPANTDPTTALREWAKHNPTAGVSADVLVAAAEKLKA